ncbi:MAG: hypothetical protein QNJ46_11035 [Leptolyngbyaceae cyanobacterium MO_188.B28]|nr:hypothetical protein [Leptolyngbyaceae cyanobacterium MO_188.B28]
MASKQDVREYLAYWFQLGKKIVLRNRRSPFLPSPVIQGDRYSQEFEDCWRDILAVDGQDCYLEGTDYTIAELLSPSWQLEDCARCEMPVPLPTSGMPAEVCPCYDLALWPNHEVPRPRSPVSSASHLTGIRERLESVESSTEDEIDEDSPQTTDSFSNQAIEENNHTNSLVSN